MFGHIMFEKLGNESTVWTYWSNREKLSELLVISFFFVMFFGSVFGRFLSCVWLVLGVNFACFSHTYSNCFFAYFFLGCFSNVCTLPKHAIFKKPCFSRVKTLFCRNRLCRQPMRKCISWDGIVPCFLLNFRDFWSLFWHSFSHRFLDAFFDQK